MSKRIPPAARPRPHAIRPTAIYFVEDLSHFLRFSKSTLKSERLAGRLRVARRCNRYYVLGEWLLQWLREGEVPSNQAAGVDCSCQGGQET